MIEIREDIPKATAFIQIIKERYGELRELMPEDLLPGGLTRGSEQHLRFITLVVSIDYMKNADGLWRGGREAFAEDGWLFDPVEVGRRSDGQVAEALARHRMTRMTKKDGRIWKRVSDTLAESWRGSVRALLEEAGFDALQLYWRVKGESTRYPYLSGPKILPLWIRMLNEEAGVSFKNMDRVPLPVDINVLKATFMLGVLRGHVEGGMGVVEELKGSCQKVWLEASHKAQFPLIRLDEPLWLLGRGDSRLQDLGQSLLVDGYRTNVDVGYDNVKIDT